jgi:hypothetical protein
MIPKLGKCNNLPHYLCGKYILSSEQVCFRKFKPSLVHLSFASSNQEVSFHVNVNVKHSKHEAATAAKLPDMSK